MKFFVTILPFLYVVYLPYNDRTYNRYIYIIRDQSRQKFGYPSQNMQFATKTSWSESKTLAGKLKKININKWLV